MTTGTGLKASRGGMKSGRAPKPARYSRGGLLGRSARNKAARIKGVKRL
jgi:hypothetical protein